MSSFGFQRSRLRLQVVSSLDSQEIRRTHYKFPLGGVSISRNLSKEMYSTVVCIDVESFQCPVWHSLFVFFPHFHL